MTDKQAVMQALDRLPEGATFEEITEEVAVMAAIQRGRNDVAAGRVKTHAEVERIVEAWHGQWNAR